MIVSFVELSETYADQILMWSRQSRDEIVLWIDYVARTNGYDGWVAIYQHQFVGHVCYQIDQARHALIDIAVHPDFRRRGVARQMLEYIFSNPLNRDILCFVAHIETENCASREFFEAMGFSSAGKTYEDGFIVSIYRAQ